MSYKDPENKNDIINDIKNAETHNEVMNIINRTFPEWIVNCCDKYSSDYNSMNINWKVICDKVGAKQLNIILVDFIKFKDPEYELINIFCELLTIFGHSVRRKDEFILCGKCNKNCIPVKSVYEDMKSKNLNVPPVWSSECSKCV